MSGLEMITGGLLYLAASGPCRAQNTPTINAKPLSSVVQYDYSKSREDLQGFDIDTVSPYEPSHHAKVGGLMSGEIRIESQVRFMQEKYPARGSACVHVHGVDVTVRVEPTIYIASEYPKGTCQFHAIVNHEKKHVQTDMAIARKYAQILKDKMLAHLRQAGVTRGPVPLERMDGTQAQIQGEFQALIKTVSDDMTRERMARQQQIDTLQEYERVAVQCPREQRGAPAGSSAPAAVPPQPRTVRPGQFNQ